MSSSIRTETETVIKRILPYLRRRGYEPETDIDFETPVRNPDRYSKGYVDLLVNCGNKTPYFIIEAKRNGRTLTKADSKQAQDYARAVKAPFYVVTNGRVVQVFNTETGEALHWNGKLADKVPAREQVKDVVATLRRRKDATDIPLGNGDSSLPFRPSLPLMQLNDLFRRCHNKIRNIEKNEETAFADFSVVLFLKLLEEKADLGEFTLPYSYRFWELAEKPASQADQVKSAIKQMLKEIRDAAYGDVLGADLHLKNPATYRYLVVELAKVSFTDSDQDVKGTAFEYFVRATLKGKKLGQYFTPRPVIDIMFELAGRESIVAALRSGTDIRVLDPACGTGGFLVYLLKESLVQVDDLLKARKITKANRDDLAEKLKRAVFHGSDANEGVASSAKMNMIIAGDGHTNIVRENSLLPRASVWPMGRADYDLIMTNPPFGTTEGDSLSRADLSKYPVPGGKGQHLFLQRMILASKPGGLICTVIDDGLLNTDTAADLRRWVMQNAELMAVLQLPDVTFKPNKINVRSSVLVLRRREVVDHDLLDSYPVTFGVLDSLGYHGTGEPIRGFDFSKVRRSLGEALLDHQIGPERRGDHWRAYDVPADEVAADGTVRWDCKYWNPDVRFRAGELLAHGGKSVKDLNSIETRRGKSPATSAYVDETDGYAVVVKAGSSITRFGEISLPDSDWVEKQVFDEMPESVKLQKGDVLLSSTGDGTLGKAAVWDLDHEALADSHVTIIRPDITVVDPYYLADFLRIGFGQEQVQRLYTGSTGLIELTAEHVDRIVVALLTTVPEQREASQALRLAEHGYRSRVDSASSDMLGARSSFDAITRAASA
ncbi:Type I restriction enzyme EcoEI M protein homolog [Propionibacterium freudenreichii]|nr:Type I restriction enzyme EcoEI M protein homolog [Propionibacterium freudenreichii]SCQ69336.1 Type I restriction enzyme EcoEI M protein homolog [Propionibacterium freudenreichii]